MAEAVTFCEPHGICPSKSVNRISNSTGTKPDQCTCSDCQCSSAYKGRDCKQFASWALGLIIACPMGLVSFALLVFLRRRHRTGKLRGWFARSRFASSTRSDSLHSSGHITLSFLERGEGASRWHIDLDHLEWDREIGSGASAQVFLGSYYDHEVAVKRFRMSAWDQSAFDDFMRAEAKAFAALNHPNIIQFYGAAFDRKTNHGFIVTEYCSKGSLAQLLTARRPEVQRSNFMPLMRGVASGMAYFHGRGFVHRDIKPGNVLLSENNIVKLCDFGLARTSNQDSTLMTAGTGTPAYMAVELITGDEAQVRCSNAVDVFSMGVLMWTLWTHEVPYARLSLTPFMLMKRITEGMRPEMPDGSRENIPPIPTEVAELVQRCWAQDPEERPSFAEISKALAQIQI